MIIDLVIGFKLLAWMNLDYTFSKMWLSLSRDINCLSLFNQSMLNPYRVISKSDSFVFPSSFKMHSNFSFNSYSKFIFKTLFNFYDSGNLVIIRERIIIALDI